MIENLKPQVQTVQKHNTIHITNRLKQAEINKKLEKDLFDLSYQLDQLQFKQGQNKRKKESIIRFINSAI